MRRTLALLAAAGFASMASMRIADAMLPELAREFAAAPGETAAVVWSFAVAYGALILVYGPLGDRLGKPLIITFGALLCAAGAVAAALAPSLPALTVARVVMGAGAGAIIPLALAWIGDTVPLAERQAVLAQYAGTTVLGMMAGAWAGGLFAQTFGWRWAFAALAALLVGVSIVLAAAMVRERRQPASSSMRPAAPSLPFLGQVAAVLAHPWGRRVLGFVFVEGALVFGALAFVPTVLHQRFGLALGTAGAAMAAFGLGGLLYSRVAAWWLRRGDSAQVAAVGGGLMLAGFIALAAMPHWGWAAPACAVVGLGYYALHSSLQVQGTQLATQARGTGMALFAGLLFFGQSLGVALGGLAFHRWSPAVCFAAAGAGLAALGYVFARQLRSKAP